MGKIIYINFKLIIILVLIVIGFSACTASIVEKPQSFSSIDEKTPEFNTFLEIRHGKEQIEHEEIADGYLYTLLNGILTVSNAEAELWRSDNNWFIEDFRLGDVDGDGITDFVFSLWKSYSFGNVYPSRMVNDDASVRNHLFIYTIKEKQVKTIWCSSNLPRPIYSFELYSEGEKTPVSSGMLLKTVEGKYSDDFSETNTEQYLYTWNKWGFLIT